MLKQASLAEIKARGIDRSNAHIVLTMRFYPRFIKKELRDDFASDLAPEKQLLNDFNASQRRLNNHNAAFADTDYQNRFNLSDKGMNLLKHYAAMSEDKDVYFACVCNVGDMCHREMLMLLAKHLFGTEIDKVYNAYAPFKQRLDEFKC